MYFKGGDVNIHAVPLNNKRGRDYTKPIIFGTTVTSLVVFLDLPGLAARLVTRCG